MLDSRREPQNKIGSLIKLNGTHTETEEETLQHMLQTQFPGSIIGEPTLNVVINGYNNRAGGADWNKSKILINHTKLKWAIQSSETFKAPGGDRIYPALLQQGLDSLLYQLCILLRASYALNYIPRMCRKIRVVFIPKPGRKTNAQAKSYRPIS